MKKCVIIYNKKSGKVKPKELIGTFYDVVEDFGYELNVITTKRQGYATEIVKELSDDIDLVIVAGGDGTFDEAIKGNMMRKKRLLLAQLPLGTTNDIGTMFGLTQNYKRDLEIILNGVKKNIDIITINGRPFVYVAAFGNYINISYDTPKKWKEIFGRLAYILFGFMGLKEKIRMYKVKYKINGEVKTGEFSFIFITNTSRVGGVDVEYPDMKLDDSKFEILLCNLKTKPEILRALVHAKNNGVENVPGCEYYSTSDFEIEFDHVPRHSWGLDGEEFKSKTSKYTFKIDKTNEILIPHKNAKKLFIKEE